ncbi:GSG2 family protein [Megaselia abdita]
MDSSFENDSFVKIKRKKPKRLQRTISTPFMVKGIVKEFECPLSPLKDNTNDSLKNLLEEEWIVTDISPVKAKNTLPVPVQRLRDTSLDRFCDNYDNTSVLRQMSIIRKNLENKPKKVSKKPKKSSIAGRSKKKDYPDVQEWMKNKMRANNRAKAKSTVPTEIRNLKTPITRKGHSAFELAYSNKALLSNENLPSISVDLTKDNRLPIVSYSKENLPPTLSTTIRPKRLSFMDENADFLLGCQTENRRKRSSTFLSQGTEKDNILSEEKNKEESWLDISDIFLRNDENEIPEHQNSIIEINNTVPEKNLEHRTSLRPPNEEIDESVRVRPVRKLVPRRSTKNTAPLRTTLNYITPNRSKRRSLITSIRCSSERRPKESLVSQFKTESIINISENETSRKSLGFDLTLENSATEQHVAHDSEDSVINATTQPLPGRKISLLESNPEVSTNTISIEKSKRNSEESSEASEVIDNDKNISGTLRKRKTRSRRLITISTLPSFSRASHSKRTSENPSESSSSTNKEHILKPRHTIRNSSTLTTLSEVSNSSLVRKRNSEESTESSENEPSVKQRKTRSKRLIRSSTLPSFSDISTCSRASNSKWISEDSAESSNFNIGVPENEPSIKQRKTRSKRLIRSSTLPSFSDISTCSKASNSNRTGEESVKQQKTRSKTLIRSSNLPSTCSRTSNVARRTFEESSSNLRISNAPSEETNNYSSYSSKSPSPVQESSISCYEVSSNISKKSNNTLSSIREEETFNIPPRVINSSKTFEISSIREETSNISDQVSQTSLRHRTRSKSSSIEKTVSSLQSIPEIVNVESQVEESDIVTELYPISRSILKSDRSVRFANPAHVNKSVRINSNDAKSLTNLHFTISEESDHTLSLTSGKWRKTLSSHRRNHSINHTSASLNYTKNITSKTIIGNRTAIALNTTEEQISPEQAILKACKQNRHLSFKRCYSKKNLGVSKKIGEGTYGEVFMTESGVVLKIIPIEGNQDITGEAQKKFGEILPEIIITQSLSQLPDTDNSGGRFVKVFGVKSVFGSYPSYLKTLWEEYDEEKASDNEHPKVFPDNQLYIVLELENAGRDLESFKFLNSIQSNSVFLQVTLSLAIAEKAFQFEHRDLHWGNILVKETEYTEIEFKLEGKIFKIPTHGVQATIIDYTLSRGICNEIQFFNDLSKDDDLFSASGDYQFDIYRLMKEKLRNNWNNYEPYTNLLWLHYLADKMIKEVTYKQKSNKKHLNNINNTLKTYYDNLLKFNSAEEFVNTFLDGKV